MAGCTGYLMGFLVEAGVAESSNLQDLARWGFLMIGVYFLR
jgi:hypothetical protein